MKRCSTCKIEQPLENFHKYHNSPDGHTHRCKSCVSRKKIVPMDKKICSSCHIEKSIDDFGKRKNGKLGRSSICKKCQKPKTDIYNKNNHSKIRKRLMKWRFEKMKTDPIFKLTARMRNRIYDFLQGRKMNKRNRTFEIVGCTPKELKEYIEKQFTDGMSWENYGYYGWHIDHKIPLDFGKTEDEIYKLCHFTNLQPMWWEENIKKGTKII